MSSLQLLTSAYSTLSSSLHSAQDFVCFGELINIWSRFSVSVLQTLDPGLSPVCNIGAVCFHVDKDYQNYQPLQP